MELEDLLFSKEDGIGIITLNRPEKLNAYTLGMWDSIVRLMAEIGRDDEMKAVIVTGAGRAFCSGGDVSMFSASGEERWRRPHPENYPATAFRRCDKPVIAAVNGYAVGAGFAAALACDFRIASEEAKFGAPFVKRGMMSDNGLSYLLPQVVGVQKALEMIMGGDMIDATEAQRLGLVLKVVPPEQLMPAALELGQRLAKGAPIALSMIKRAVYKAQHSTLEATLEFESLGAARIRFTQDVREGVQAFFEKREPQFKGM